nr:hypothetical protein [Desulfobulbaceae bacterium]
MKSVNRRTAVLAVVVLFLFMIPVNLFGQTERFDISIGKSIQKGPVDAPVTIIEFLDFQ